MCKINKYHRKIEVDSRWPRLRTNFSHIMPTYRICCFPFALPLKIARLFCLLIFFSFSFLVAVHDRIVRRWRTNASCLECTKGPILYPWYLSLWWLVAGGWVNEWRPSMTNYRHIVNIGRRWSIENWWTGPLRIGVFEKSRHREPLVVKIFRMPRIFEVLIDSFIYSHRFVSFVLSFKNDLLKSL